MVTSFDIQRLETTSRKGPRPAAGKGCWIMRRAMGSSGTSTCKDDGMGVHGESGQAGFLCMGFASNSAAFDTSSHSSTTASLFQAPLSAISLLSPSLLPP